MSLDREPAQTLAQPTPFAAWVSRLRTNPRATLSLVYLRQVSAGLLIYQPVFIPFLLSRGLNMLDVALLQTAYNLGVLLLDIPTGAFADRFGRKWALAMANASLVLGTILIAAGHTLSTFIVAELFYALAIAMDSGTHSAYLFEWLRARGRESEYYRFDAFGTFLFLVIGALGTLVAGYFAERDLLIPVVMTVALTAIGIPAACLLPETGRGQGKESPPRAPSLGLADPAPAARRIGLGMEKIMALRQGARRIWEIMLEIFRTPGLRWAMGITIIWFWSRQYVNLIISQPYFQSIHLELRQFGMLYSIMTLASGLIALFSRRLIQRPDLRVVAGVGLVLIPTCFLVMGLIASKPGLTGFFLFAIPYGLCTAVTNTLLNRQFSGNADRATFLSIVDFFQRLIASILAIVLGWILARAGAAAALLSAALVSGAIAAVLLPGVLRFAGRQPEPKSPSTPA